MAKQVILLETFPGEGAITTRAVFWFAIPANRRVPIAGFPGSAWSGASAAETSDLANGVVMEEVHSLKWPASFTTVEIKAALLKAYADRQTFLAAQPFRLQYAGVFYDPAAGGWSA